MATRRSLVLLLSVLSASCAPTSGFELANGSLGLTRDESLLFLAEADVDAVYVVDARTNAVVRRVGVGRQPEKVLVTADDTIYVTNRLGRSVSVLHRDEPLEVARLAVGVEPVGLAASADGHTLYVVNATSLTDSDVGTVMAFDTTTRSLRWEAVVGPEPRGIALLADGRAAVTLSKAGDVALLDAERGQVLRAQTDVYARLNRTALAAGAPAARLAHPRGLDAIVAAPDGQQVYAAGLLSSQGVLPGPSSVVGAPAGYSGGNCGATAVATPALLTFDARGTPLVDDVLTCNSDGTERPSTILVTTRPGSPLQVPRAMAIDATGSFLFLADFASNHLAVVATSGNGPTGLPGNGYRVPGPALGGRVEQVVRDVGAGPSGVAVSRDGRRVWVHASLDHVVTRLEVAASELVKVGSVRLMADALPPDVVAGRKLFFGATDARMNDPLLGISCGSCHLEGREDGHVWNFPDGPRQTPSLAGRQLARTAPYHWDGAFDDLPSFMRMTVETRMGGTGVTPEMAAQLAAFLDAQPAPDNPHRGVLDAAARRGQALFSQARCDSCHGGEAFTSGAFADVGTLVTAGAVPDNPLTLARGGLNTPSLLGLARSAPYLHDGSAPSLKARLLRGQADDRHGLTSSLREADVDDVVAYLKTL
jgi:YVTN family beta-propeller protein